MEPSHTPFVKVDVRGSYGAPRLHRRVPVSAKSAVGDLPYWQDNDAESAKTVSRSTC